MNKLTFNCSPRHIFLDALLFGLFFRMDRQQYAPCLTCPYPHNDHL